MSRHCHKVTAFFVYLVFKMNMMKSGLEYGTSLTRVWCQLCECLDSTDCYVCVFVLRISLSFFFFGSAHTCWVFYSEPCICALFRDPQILLFNNFFIKNRSHGIIYTFKNYFTTMFSVSVKISSIQTDLICHLVGICHLYDVNPIIQLG